MSEEARKLNIIREVLNLDDESTLDALVNLLESSGRQHTEIQKSPLLSNQSHPLKIPAIPFK
jgi:hypothetical protein